MAHGTARIGCSGWVYKDWRGRLYPEKLPTKRWFEVYSQRFSTVEINNTFYRMPSEDAVESWHAQAPPDFIYSVKVSRFGSHRKKLKDPQMWVPHHLERMSALAEHLGPNLIQLPPRWSRDVGRLQDLLAVIDELDSKGLWALEVRDPSWLHDEVFQTLKDHGTALCVHDMLPDHPWVLTADWAYVRFHGTGDDKYHGRYGSHRLTSVSSRLRAWLEEGVDVYAYFNNDVEGAAVDDATWLDESIKQHNGNTHTSNHLYHQQ